MKKVILILSFVAIAVSSVAKNKSQELIWIEFDQIGLEGKGWEKTELPYSRIPIKAIDKVPEAVKKHGLTSTGHCINFETDSSQIWIRREQVDPNRRMSPPNFNNCAFSGFDLYSTDANGKYRWLATVSDKDEVSPEFRLFNTDKKMRPYRIYMPMRGILKSAKLGIVKGSKFKVIPARDKPIVFYGTSIVHGSNVSHAGLSHPSLIGRRVDKPIINFGFSGSAKMEIEMAELLGELDASVYVIDTQANMDEKLVKERCEKFLRRLRELRPNTPILLVEMAQSAREWYTGESRFIRNMWDAQRAIYKKFLKEGETKMLYLKGDNLFGEHGEASIDNCHPGDLGIMNMADKMTPLIEQLLRDK